MVDESLVQYLSNLQDFKNIDDFDTKIRNLLDYTKEKNEFTKKESLKIIDALDKIKILDPACGSGAFPMGILQKMLLILQKIDPESIEWMIKQIERIPNQAVKKAVEDEMMNKDWDYIHKMGIIRTR
jgi:type II restriction/modification system DNA methylase subunit YeeA